jgi:hypothetical protein
MAVMQTLSAIVARLKQRRKTSIALAVMVALVGIYFGPLLITHPAQDACTFGTVSNERYRQLLAEAKRRQATTWPALVWDNKKTMALLNKRVDDLSGGTTSVYERLAAMHAVVRALGGDYRQTEADVENPFGSQNRSGLVGYDYHVDLNGVGFFAPIWRHMWVIGTLVFNAHGGSIVQDRRRSQPGNIDFIVWYPSFFDSYITVERSKFGESCPRLPDAALVERLSQPEKQ